MIASTKGRCCPTCGQLVKLYTWTLLDSMVHALSYLASQTTPSGRFIMLNEGLTPSYITRSRTFPKLRHWGLIEAGERGEWRPTQRGVDFLEGRITVPKRVYVFNNEKRDESEEQVSARAALESFDYKEMTA